MDPGDLLRALQILTHKLETLTFTDEELELAADIAEWYSHRLIASLHDEVRALRAELAVAKR